MNFLKGKPGKTGNTRFMLMANYHCHSRSQNEEHCSLPHVEDKHGKPIESFESQVKQVKYQSLWL